MSSPTRYALISVSDKTGVVDLARAFREHGIGIYSTGGTAAALRDAGIDVEKISDLTAFPEIMDGRVKTLHPKIFGGILADRDKAAHLEAASQHGIPPFDFVVVNLYPFARTVAREDVTAAEAIENIDIGGVALIRAAAKNHRHVAVLTNPAAYATLMEELATEKGSASAELRERLAMEAFAHTAAYDAQIAAWFRRAGSEEFPDQLSLPLDKVMDLRYGENPHQGAALYRRTDQPRGGIVDTEQLQGKPLSYNNLMDADTALFLANEFSSPAVAILKHANPCGVAVAETVAEAYAAALATDPVSAFGGIIGVNRPLDEATARQILDVFTEVILAPEFTKAALDLLAAKKNLRLLKTDAELARRIASLDLRPVAGGLLVQDKDLHPDDDTSFKVVTRRAPTANEQKSLAFAWKVVKWVKSNAIVFARDGQTLGIGAGQMSRVDATQFAVAKAANAGLSLDGCVLASDAFFPFADSIDAAAAAGASAVIQPGGSIRDAEVIEAADKAGIAMVFTGVRHFRH